MYVNGTQFQLLQLFALHNSWINPFGIATTEHLIVGDIRSNDVYLACSFGGKKAQSQADSSFWPMASVPVTISHGKTASRWEHICKGEIIWQDRKTQSGEESGLTLSNNLLSRTLQGSRRTQSRTLCDMSFVFK